MKGDPTSVEWIVDRTREIAATDDWDRLRVAFVEALVECAPGLDASRQESGRIVGQAFARLFPVGTRLNGQVYTPAWAADVMAGWALVGDHSLALDAGCGSGVLLAAAGNRAPGLPLLGVETDPLAVDMSVQARRLGGFDADIVLTDFLLDHIDQQPTAVLCNPPYTRHHQRTTKHKDAIEESIGRRLGIRYTRTASLHALFLARAVEIAAPGARLAFITPSQWLDTRYGMAVKAYVQSHARIVAVVELSAHFFAEVQTSAAITLLQKDRKGDPEPIRMTVDDPLPAPDDLLEQIEARTLLGSKWRRSRSRPRGERLGDLARVRRGVATGHNRFFVLSEARRHEHDIPKRAVVPCIASPRLLDGNALTSEDLATLDNETPRWLLKVGPKHSAEAILKYLEHGKTLGAHQRALSRERNPWYALRWTGTFPILWSYLNQKDPRFVLNQAGAVPLNNWLVIEPHDPERVDELFGRLSSTAFLHHARSRGKHYGRGLWKLEPSDVADLLLPPA